MRADRVLPALPPLAAIVAYFNSFGGSFQFDDFNVIVDNPAVHTLAAWFSDLSGGVRPLLKLTYCLNHLAGPGPWGFHLVNLAVHSLSSLLVYVAGLRIFGREGSMKALLCALLFALHPVRTEAVTYISGRSVSLSALVVLLSFLAFLKESEEGRRGLLSPFLFVLALAVRETAAILPLLLLLWELYTGRTVREGFRNVRIHFAVLIVFFAFLLLRGGPFLLYTRGLVEFEGSNLYLRQAHSVFYLLTRWLNPFSQNIDPDLSDQVELWAGTAAEILVLVLLFAVGVRLLLKRSPVGFGILWFFFNLAPTNSLLPRYDAANERHLYLAALGLEWALIAAAWPLFRNRPRIAVPTAAAVFLALATATWSRNIDYRSEVSLWEDTAGKSPGKARVQNNLGYAYLASGDPARAMERFALALKLDPAHESARRNLAVARKKLGKLE